MLLSSGIAGQPLPVQNFLLSLALSIHELDTLS